MTTLKLDTPSEIDEHIAQLQRLRDDLIRKEKRTHVRQVVKTMREYGIDLNDVGKEYERQSRSASALRVPGIDKPPVPAKYEHPETGAKWSGRGIAPRWVREFEENGGSRDELLIKEDVSAASAPHPHAKPEPSSSTERAIAASPAPQTSNANKTNK